MAHARGTGIPPTRMACSPRLPVRCATGTAGRTAVNREQGVIDGSGPSRQGASQLGSHGTTRGAALSLLP